jgi:DsbC/DsbD-like thiol-disulfide interchange protein
MTQYNHDRSLTHLMRVATLAGWFFFGCAALSGAAHAERSAWFQTPGGGIRLVAGAVTPEGTLPAMLEIRLEPGWRTYWTDPGASGLPPEMMVTGQDGHGAALRFSGMRLPVPRRFDEGDLQYTGYDRPVAFPLILEGAAPGEDIRLSASVFLGICKSICIPVQATLDLAVSGTAPENALDAARIRTAFAALPQPPAPDFTVEKATFHADERAITLLLRLPDGASDPQVFLAGPSGYTFHHPEIGTSKDGLTPVRIGLTLPPKATFPPADGTIRATIATGARAMETPLVFGP